VFKNALLFLLAAQTALPAIAQLLPAPEPSDGLPPGVDQLRGGSVVSELPAGEPWPASSSASTELPELPPWCDGTCVIDIAFFYDPEVIGEAVDDGYTLVTVDEAWLRNRVLHLVNFADTALARAGLDAEVRLVGMERDQALSGLNLTEALRHVQDERLSYVRQKYGADLVYAITSRDDGCSTEYSRPRGVSRATAARYAAGAMAHAAGGFTCWSTPRFARSLGAQLGLASNPETASFTPFVPFGHGFVGHGFLGTTRIRRTDASIMAGGGMPYFSTSAPVHGRVLGDQDVSDAARALRYTIPDAARYSPTVVPQGKDSHGYGCRPSDRRACLNQRRFGVSARYSTPSVSRAVAKRLDIVGLADTGALFYYFAPDNPEMLIKVVNGCWLNDHWWVFGSAATDLPYELAIEDLATDSGQMVEYRHVGAGVIIGDNGFSTATGVLNDTSAFPCGSTAAVQAGERPPDSPVIRPLLSTNKGGSGRAAGQGTGDGSDYGCHSTYVSACLNNWRFEVHGAPGSFQNRLSDGQPLQTHGLGDSAVLLYFFEPDNPELLIKVVSGCAINGHWWVFASAATDLPWYLRIFDWARTPAGFSRRYQHRGGGRITGGDMNESGRYTGFNGYSTHAGVIADTTAFPCSQ